MTPIAQPTENTNSTNCSYLKDNTARTLYQELEQGIQSMREEEVYSIEDAWKEVDKI